jgi:hypothetical protein
MKKTFSIFAVSIVLSFLFLQVTTPFIALGIDNGTGPSATISNPLKVNSIQDLISEALKFVVNLLAIAGVVYIIWTGFLFVKAQGNPTELEKAKKSFMNAIIGMAIILGAWGIATVIANTINKINGNDDIKMGPLK